MKDYTSEQIEASQAQLCQNAPKVASLRPALGQVGGICFLWLKLLSHFYCPFSTGLPPPGAIKSRFCNSLSVAPSIRLFHP